MRIKVKDTKKCLVCKSVFKIFRTTDQFCSAKCHNFFHSPEEIKKRHKEAKISVYGKNVYKYLQDEINYVVRLIDRGHPDISSNLPYGTYIVNAGHYYSVGSQKQLRYNLLNIFNQSAQDNNQGGGKGSNYGHNLIKVFGLKIFEEIDQLPAKYPELHLTKNEAQEKREIVKQIIQELEQINITFSTEYRIEVRKKLNQRIGIYK